MFYLHRVSNLCSLWSRHVDSCKRHNRKQTICLRSRSVAHHKSATVAGVFSIYYGRLFLLGIPIKMSSSEQGACSNKTPLSDSAKFHQGRHLLRKGIVGVSIFLQIKHYFFQVFFRRLSDEL